eukprot:jgi/Hompol1/6593/HPOL_003154-RA
MYASSRVFCLHNLISTASTKEVLVPIKIDFDIDGFHVRDSFTWNLNEPIITPSKFAQYLCNDLDLDEKIFVPQIAREIESQLDDHRRFFYTSDFPAAEDSRVAIKLNIQVGKMHLRDRFEWDLASSLSPETFAQLLVRDLRLGGEFVQLIAFSIREQLHRIRRDGEIDAAFPIEKPFRAEEEARTWGPHISASNARMDDEEDEVNDVAKERNSRRMRRELRTSTSGSRRRGAAYPTTSELRVSIRDADNTPHELPSVLSAEERAVWACSHCLCTVGNTTVLRPGPLGANTLCNACATPRAAENFLALCASGYYNNNLFHRNIKGFMVQTGDPTGNGKGGTSIWGRKFEDEIKPTLKHNARGIVSMANKGPDTNGSQFFIVYSKQPHLDSKYTVFGKVIDGMDTLDALEKLPVDASNRPLQDVRIQSVTIHANPIADGF